MRRWNLRPAPVVMAAVTICVITAAAQDGSLDNRMLRVSGIQPAVAREFFTGLRRALGSGDQQEACARIAYPLRQPSGDIQDAAQCQARYDDIFTVTVRRAVGKAQFDTLFPTPDGIVVGFGELRFGSCQAPGCGDGVLRVTQVNGAGGQALKPPRGKTVVACAAPGAQVRVVADGDGGADLLLWTEPGANPSALTRPPADGAAPPGPPSIALKSQPSDRARSPECAYREWTFGDDTATYSVVTDLGCLEMNDGVPPMGSIAQVVRITAARGRETLWCVE